MKKSKFIKSAFKALKDTDPSDVEGVQKSLDKFLGLMGFDSNKVPIIKPDIPNKAVPAFDCLDFDEIQKSLEDQGIE